MLRKAEGREGSAEVKESLSGLLKVGNIDGTGFSKNASRKAVEIGERFRTRSICRPTKAEVKHAQTYLYQMISDRARKAFMRLVMS